MQTRKAFPDMGLSRSITTMAQSHAMWRGPLSIGWIDLRLLSFMLYDPIPACFKIQVFLQPVKPRLVAG